MKNSRIMFAASLGCLAVAITQDGGVAIIVSTIFLATSVICDTIETKG